LIITQRHAENAEKALEELKNVKKQAEVAAASALTLSMRLGLSLMQEMMS
jgi:hypothetical protein